MTTTIPTASKRYVHLDGLRGVLAIAVVIHHFAFAMQLPWFNMAWVSVDAFFILSGFVIAHSYQNKISRGLGLREFFYARVGRLYPVYFVGLLLGFAALICTQLTPPDAAQQAKAVGFGLLVLPFLNADTWPAIAGTSTGSAFPLNDPAWSLFFELFVNLVFFAWLRYGGLLKPWSIVAILLVIHLVSSQYFGLHSGWAAENFLGGFSRVTLFFFLGVAVYSTHTQIRLRAPGLFFSAAAAMLIGFMFKNIALNYLLLFLIAPLTILAGSRTNESTGRGAVLMTWLGGISYPIYITHYPLGSLLRSTTLSDLSAPQFVFFATVISIVVADLIARSEQKTRRLWRNRAQAKITARP